MARTKTFFSIILIGLAFVFCNQASAYYDIKDSSNFSWEQLQALVESNKLTSVDATLEQIKAYYPEFFENYILMYHSRSLQGSSFENPRAVLFDRSGQFVFSFNGHPTQRGYDRLEIMQFRNDEHSFEFREVIFNGNKATFSEPNPAKCMVCHQDVQRSNIDPRPNWEPYNLWPGAFGSNSGRMGIQGYYEMKQPRFQRIDPPMLEKMKQEKEKLGEFFKSNQATHGRYRFLNKEAFDPHFTVEFTQMMAELNFRRIARILTTELKELYSYLEPAVWGVARCGKLMVKPETYEWIQKNWTKKEYLEEEYLLKHPPIQSKAKIVMQLRTDRFVDDIEELSNDEMMKVAESIYQQQFERRKGHMAVSPSQGLHHLFDPLGVSTADWSMDFKTDGRLAFKERFGTPANTRAALLNGLRKVTGIRRQKLSCEELGRRAEENFERLKESSLFQKLKQQKQQHLFSRNAPILDRCVKCHSSGYDPSIPSIAFDDPEVLTKQLAQPAIYSSRKLINEIKYRLGDYAKESERMPMGPITTKKQRLDLIEYMEGLMEKK